jgi:glycosyltransferase involved in cell wall biosynthesis
LTRIALIIPTLDQSGAERQLAILAAALSQSEFQPKVFALNRGGHYETLLKAAGVPVEILGKSFRFDPTAALRLRQSLRIFQPHIAQSFLFSANTLVRLPGVVPPACRIIISERCVDSWKSRWQLTIDRWLVQRADALVGNSASVLEFYRKLGFPPEKTHLIPNAAPAPGAPLSRATARKMLQLPEDGPVIGFVGRLAPQKRLRDLVWAFQLLHQVRPDARLVLIGDGPARTTLESLTDTFDSRPKITFAGHRTDAAALLPALDAFVLPSEFEGMSNSLMEAMQQGLPCVVSNIPANTELIRHMENGLTFPLGDSPALAKALLKLFSTPALSLQIGRAAAATIATEYSPERVLAAWCQLYRSLTASN